MGLFKWIKSVFLGYYYLIFKKDKVEDMAIRRAVFCKNCPHAKMSNTDIVYDKRITFLSGRHCEECGCPLAAKLRSPMEECPIGLWGEENL